MVTFVCSELGQGTTGCTGECCFGVIYGEWYGVCDCVVLSVVEVCVDYGIVNEFHVSLNFYIEEITHVSECGVCFATFDIVCDEFDNGVWEVYLLWFICEYVDWDFAHG